MVNRLSFFVFLQKKVEKALNTKIMTADNNIVGTKPQARDCWLSPF